MESIDLKDVSICVVDCLNYDNAAISLIFSSKYCNIKFAEAIYLSDKKHEKLDKFNIKFVEIDKIDSFNKYNYFVIKNLYKYINTRHFLLVQHDGIIYRPDIWNKKFLEYDYIGSPWTGPPISEFPENIVGNGGFSLRSKRIQHAVSQIEGYSCDIHCRETNEDVFTSVINRAKFEKMGFKFPTPEIAATFANEALLTNYGKTIEYESFGCHVCTSNINQIKKHKKFLDDVRKKVYSEW